MSQALVHYSYYRTLISKVGRLHYSIIDNALKYQLYYSYLCAHLRSYEQHCRNCRTTECR